MSRSLRSRFVVLFATFVLFPIAAVSSVGLFASQVLAERSSEEYEKGVRRHAEADVQQRLYTLAAGQERAFQDIERRATALAATAASLFSHRTAVERSGLWDPGRLKKGGYGWVTAEDSPSAIWLPRKADPSAIAPDLSVLAWVELALLAEPQAPGMAQWYIIHRSATAIVVPRPPHIPEEADFDPRESEFYVPATPGKNPAGRVVWSSLYNDPAGRGATITCLAPIVSGDGFEGVIGIDISMEEFRRQIATSRTGWNVAFITDGADRILLATPDACSVLGIRIPDHAREEILDWKTADVPGPSLRSACDAFRNSPAGIATISSGDRTHFVAHRRLAPTGWVLAVLGDATHLSSPVEGMRATQDTLHRQFLFTLITLLAILLVSGAAFAYFLTRQVARPVLELADAARHIGAGEPAAVLPAGAFAELEVLTATLRHMVRDREEAQRAIAEAQKLAALGGLASGICHELNNLLAPILGFAQVLGRGPLTAEQRAQIERVEKAARGAREIVGSLLDSTHELAGVRRPVDVNATVREALGQLEPAVDAAEIEVVLRLDPGLPMTMANPALLQRAVYNIAHNGVQAMVERPGRRILTVATAVASGPPASSAGVAAPVEVRPMSPSSDRIVITIDDTGPGVPKDLRSRIFDPFFTTKPPGSGTGLGLSVATSCIRSHSGTLAVQDAPGGGARFTATFPIILPPEGTDARHQTSTPPVPAKDRPRVLIVDDEDSIRILVRHALSDAAELVECDSGGAAVAALESREFDAVLCDLRLRDMSGRDIHAWIRGNRPSLLKKFIVLTGDTHGEETLEFLEESRSPCLTKPFDLDELRERVLGLIANSR